MIRRFSIALLNGLWYLTALAIVLAAALATLGREVLPQLRLDNDRLSAWLGERLHAQIELDDLRASWVSVLPEFRLQGVHVKTAALDLQLDHVRVDVDVWRTLYTRRAVLGRLELDSAHLVYAPPADAPAGAVDVDATWRIVYALLNNNVHIRDVAVELQQPGQARQLHVQDFRVEKTLFDKKLFLRLLDRAGNEDLQVVGRLSGDSLSSSRGELYVKLTDVALHDWMNAMPASQDEADVWQHWRQQWAAADWQCNGESWISWQGLEHLDAVTKLSVSQQQAAGLPQRLQTQLSTQWRGADDLALTVHSLDISGADPATSTRWLSDVLLTRKQPRQWRVQTAALDLAPLAGAAQWLPPGTVHDLLASLHPTGWLRNVDLRWDAAAETADRLRIRTNVEQVSSGAWQGVPAFTQVDGYVESGLHYGFIDLDSRHGFSMHYPGVYHEPLAFSEAQGRVQWQVMPAEKTVLVGSDYVKLESDAGHARGNFHLRLPMPGADFHSQMTLVVGLRDSEARYRDRFLPYILPESLQAWLKKSIGEARISNAGFIYRGALVGHEEFARAVQFYADFDRGDLQFDPAWPRMNGLAGRVLVDDGEVSVHATAGKLYDSDIRDAMIHVQPVAPGLLVSVEAQARGPVADGLRILRETPVHAQVGPALDSWVAAGSADTALKLAIPLSHAEVAPMQDVQIALHDAQLDMKDTRLQFEALNGDLSWRSADGLSAPALQAQFFQRPVTVAISSRKTPDALAIDVKANGSVTMASLGQWSQLTPLQMLQGEAGYSAALALGPFRASSKPDERIGQLQISSDLHGVAIPLPVPFAKDAADKAALSLAVDLYHNRQVYRASVTDQNRVTRLDAALSVRDGKLFSGEIGLLGQPAALPETASPLRIHGRVDDAVLETWLDVIGAYVRRLPDKTAADTAYPVFDLQLGKVHWRDLTYADVGLQVAHDAAEWRVHFDSAQARGEIRLHDDRSVPDVRLSRFSIDRSEKASEPLAPTEEPKPVDIDFASVPSANVAIEHFVFNGMDVGQASFQMRSAADRLLFDNVSVTGPGYAVRGSQNAQGAQLLWRKESDGRQRSEFHGLLHMQGEQPALKHLGVDPFVRGENVYLTSDISWHGSPLDIRPVALEGDVQAHGINGKYYQASPTAGMQLVNVLNIANWAKRLRMDFSDLSSDGISFDQFRAGMRFHDGTMAFSEPMSVHSPSSSMLMSGNVMLRDEKLDLQLEATLPVGNNATWIAALAGGLPTAAGVYLVSKVFGNQLDKITTLTYSITGPLKEPAISFERMARPKIGQ